MRNILVIAFLAFASIANAQSVEVGNAHEIGEIPRRDIFAKASVNGATLEVRKADRFADVDRFALLTVRDGSHGAFVGGGTSQGAMLPEFVIGVIGSKNILNLSTEGSLFLQDWVHDVTLVGVSASVAADAGFATVTGAGTITSDRDTYGYSITVARGNVSAYGSAGREVYWNPPRDLDDLREIGVNVSRQIIPLVALNLNAAVGKRDAYTYSAYRFSVKLGQ